MQEKLTTQPETLTRTKSEQTRLAGSVGATALTPELIIGGFHKLQQKGTNEQFAELMSQTE